MATNNNDRLINLINYLPQNYQDTQIEQFLKFFEDFLNYNLFKANINEEESYVSVLK